LNTNFLGLLTKKTRLFDNILRCQLFYCFWRSELL